MEPQTTTNKMADPLELEQSTPQRSQYISGIKRNNPDSPDSYSPSDKQPEKQTRTFSPLSKSLDNVIVDQVTSDRLFSFLMWSVLPLTIPISFHQSYLP
jgi:hypothetical protein